MQGTSENEQKAVVVLEDYSVIVAEKEALQAFFTDGKNIDALYGQVEKMAKGLVADVATKEGVSQIKSCARQIASVRKKVDDIGKAVVADLKALPGIIDNNRKRFREMTEALQDEIRRPVTEIENREDEIDCIKVVHLKLATADSKQIKKELDFVRSIPLTEDKWHESLEKAKSAIDGEAKALALLLDTALKREKDAEELAELRKNQEEADRIIRENKIKEEARAEGFAQGKAAAVPTAPAIATVRPPIPAPAPFPAPSQKAPQAPAQPQQAGSRFTPEMKAVNNAIVAAIARIIGEKLQGFTESGYELAAREVVKAILNGKIDNLKVEY